jgi:hypothetical protein
LVLDKKIVQLARWNPGTKGWNRIEAHLRECANALLGEAPIPEVSSVMK